MATAQSDPAPGWPDAPSLAAFAAESVWLRPARTAPTLMVVFGHPDDETFGNGGTLARYGLAGANVHSVCATRGESGMASDEDLAGHADTAALRTSEMLCAARTLGLTSVHFLGYRDSGMPGSPENDQPGAFAAAPEEEAIGRVTGLIRALRPDVVVTFNPYGGYGHPDHIAAHRAAVGAFHASGDPSRFPEQLAAGLQAWVPKKLYYATFGVSLLRVGIPLLRLMRRDPRRFGENGDVDLLEAARQVTPATTTLDTAAVADLKLRAVQCHASQLGGMRWMASLPSPLRRRLQASEHFTRVEPPWPGGPPERDLFEALDTPS